MSLDGVFLPWKDKYVRLHLPRNIAMETRNRIKVRRLVVGLLVCSMAFVTISPVLAQPGRHYPGPPRPPYHGPPRPPHHHHGPSDFDKTMRVIGTVGAIAAIANGASRYSYYRQQQPVVVVPAQPTVVVQKVVERPIIVEKVVDRPVVVEKTVAVPMGDNYSYRLGAAFEIQKMQIPGYKFTAARLTSDPVEGSPLSRLGLVKGDVITRLNNEAVTSLSVLDNHERSTAVRYIKRGTTKVVLDKIYIPPDDELGSENVYGDDVYYAP